jgi:hypothetical protein
VCVHNPCLSRPFHKSGATHTCTHWRLTLNGIVHIVHTRLPIIRRICFCVCVVCGRSTPNVFVHCLYTLVAHEHMDIPTMSIHVVHTHTHFVHWSHTPRLCATTVARGRVLIIGYALFVTDYTKWVPVPMRIWLVIIVVYVAESIFVYRNYLSVWSDKNPNQKPMLSMMSRYCEHTECVRVWSVWIVCISHNMRTHTRAHPIRVLANNLSV